MKRQALREVATYQKGIIVCILIYFIALIVNFAVAAEMRILVWVVGGALSLAAAVFVFLLATKVFSTGVGIVLAILTLIPIVGLIALVIINGKATAILKKHGIHVGFLGASLSDIE